MKGPTRKQNRIIHVLENQMIRKGLLDEGGYRLLLMGWFGRQSSSDLNHAEASFLIDQLVKMGGVISEDRKQGSRRRLTRSTFHGESSLEGLRNEIIQIARERYGEDFEKPLRALCNKLKITDYRTMDVRHGKALKETLLRLQAEGPYLPENE